MIENSKDQEQPVYEKLFLVSVKPLYGTAVTAVQTLVSLSDFTNPRRQQVDFNVATASWGITIGLHALGRCYRVIRLTQQERRKNALSDRIVPYL